MHQHTQRAAQETDCGPTVQILSEEPKASKFAECKLVDYHVWCAMLKLTASLKQSQKQLRNSRNRFRLSGATYHIDKTAKDFSN